MDRRTFLRVAAALPAVAAASQLTGLAARARAQQKEFTPRPGTWRTFEITTRVEVMEPVGVTRAWLPIPSVKAEYQKPLGDQWSGNAKVMKTVTDGSYGAGMLYAEFAAGETAPVVELTSRFQIQDRALDWSKKIAAAEEPAILKLWTKSTDLIPIDGIVHETALEVTKGKASDVDKVKAVYDWVLAHAYREPKVRGCGVGDIKTMLETRNFGGKCGDINALLVGLVRSVGVPARDVYGIRVAPSAFGYKSLGAGSANISRAQHCRAEVFLKDYGWVAVDPADVTKVAREETSEWLKVEHPLVEAVRPKLFGGWEGNWVAFNTAHDVTLPGATQGGKLGFFMYPQSETAQGRRDSLDPDNFKYTITTREITA
ncbi:MAG TPA: transglutaminase domain-containing protein [Candidatus Binatia bacterium]|nr:transglutaminase domain-containing protein [Candidatus Binatia bacterium]